MEWPLSLIALFCLISGAYAEPLNEDKAIALAKAKCMEPASARWPGVKFKWSASPYSEGGDGRWYVSAESDPFGELGFASVRFFTLVPGEFPCRGGPVFQ